MAAPMNMWNLLFKSLRKHFWIIYYVIFFNNLHICKCLLSYQTRIVIDMIGLASQDILYLVYLLNSWNCEIPYIEHMFCVYCDRAE